MQQVYLKQIVFCIPTSEICLKVSRTFIKGIHIIHQHFFPAILAYDSPIGQLGESNASLPYCFKDLLSRHWDDDMVEVNLLNHGSLLGPCCLLSITMCVTWCLKYDSGNHPLYTRESHECLGIALNAKKSFPYKQVKWTILPWLPEYNVNGSILKAVMNWSLGRTIPPCLI